MAFALSHTCDQTVDLGLQVALLEEHLDNDNKPDGFRRDVANQFMERNK
ncbi:hypothetical protein T05_10579 [Trichinella murrelli]|uniref:Uncharacterized protein n=1 Tax=Trichinella murrelli TaxID=144512 RepID=A0A0V0UA64_9BILA|nr:hypothetical protein T05_10579 [Trichinella murrelli]